MEKQLNTEVWEEEQRFENPHEHYLDMSPAYYEMKMDMLHELDILYNRARQAAITQEITEVIAGAKAQKRKKKR